MAMVAGCFILLVAYLMFPEAFHYFIHYVKHMFFSALHSSFGKNPLSGQEHHHAPMHHPSHSHASPNSSGFSGGSNNLGPEK